MLMIQYGVTDLGIPGGVTVPVQEIITHEEYIDDGRYNYDIALLKLKEDIVFGGTAQPIKLPKCKGCTTATSGFVAGWGQQYDVRLFFWIFFYTGIVNKKIILNCNCHFLESESQWPAPGVSANHQIEHN